MNAAYYLAWAYPSAIEPYAGPFFRTQAEALVRQGVHLRVIAPVPWAHGIMGRLSEHWRVYCDIPREQLQGGVHVQWPRYAVIPSSETLAVAHHFLGPVLRRVLNERPSLLHAHGAYPLGLCCARYARRAGIPVVLTLHGGDINVFPDVSGRLRRHVIAAVRESTHVIAVSRALAKKAESLTGVSPQVLPIGVDTRRFRPASPGERQAERHALGLPPNGKLVLYVGSLYSSKGINELCAALADLAHEGVYGIFVGDGPLRSAVTALPTAVLAGRVSNDIVRRYMVACDVLALPSYTEGLPTVLVEAGMVGLPVVATAVGGIPELLGADRGAMLPPRNVRALRDVIRRALDDPHGTPAMAERLQRHVHKEYDAAANAARLSEIYSEVVRGHQEHVLAADPGRHFSPEPDSGARL